MDDSLDVPEVIARAHATREYFRQATRIGAELDALDRPAEPEPLTPAERATAIADGSVELRQALARMVHRYGKDEGVRIFLNACLVSNTASKPDQTAKIAGYVESYRQKKRRLDREKRKARMRAKPAPKPERRKPKAGASLDFTRVPV